MRITPLDIRKQEFRRAMRGLDAEEVYAFLSTVGDEYEAILNDNKALRERVLELDDKVQEYRRMEKTLRDTLLTAERVTVEAKDNARREANLIIKEAQIEAEKALRNIKNEAMKLRQEVSQLRSQRESYLGRMKVIAESLLKFIESVDVDFQSEDEAFTRQLPEPDEPEGEMLMADSPAETADLFEVDEDASEERRDVPGADRAGTRDGTDDSPQASTGLGPARDEREAQATAGVPPNMRTQVAADSGRSHTVPAAEPVVPVPRDPRPGDAPPAPRATDTNHAPAVGGGDDSDDGTKATLADINAIIERMADGQREMFGESRSTVPERPERPATPATGDVVRGGGERRAPVRGTWDRVPEVATAVKAPPAVDTAESRQSTLPQSTLPQGTLSQSTLAQSTLAQSTHPQKTKVPAGNDVTSKLSLDQIRRDLDRRVSSDDENSR